MNNKILAVAAIAALLIASVAITTDIAFATTKKKTQTTAQQDNCGNGTLPLDIFCQALSSQIQGSANAANMIGVQPASATHALPPPPPK